MSEINKETVILDIMGFKRLLSVNPKKMPSIIYMPVLPNKVLKNGSHTSKMTFRLSDIDFAENKCVFKAIDIRRTE